MKALDRVRAAGDMLRDAGIGHPMRDAELIIAHCLRISRVTLFRDDPEIDDKTLPVIDKLLRRRARREPLQYILGYTEFLGLIIQVGPGVLIPRPETELLVDEAIRRIEECRTCPAKVRILDLCTGSGCIALALGRKFPDAVVFGTDVSETAIRFAEENARINAVRNAGFLRGSLFEPLQEMRQKEASVNAYDLIISNPPYIRTGDLSDLQPEIRDWEPVNALNGGEDGLDYYRIIVSQSRTCLAGHGALIFEIGVNQADAVREMAMASGYRHISVRKDYAGIERIITVSP